MELCSLCEKGDYIEVVSYIHNKHPDINRLVGVHPIQRTALQHAAEYGHLEIVKELVASGATVDTKGSNGRTALHDACIGGSNDVLVYLISHTTDVNAVDNNNQTALHLACFHGESECVQALIQHGCDLMCRDKSLKNCLDVAMVNDQNQIVRVLLSWNVELLNKTNPVCGESSVHVAARYGAIKCLTLLIKKNYAHITKPDSKGILPCHVAALHGQLPALKLMLFKDRAMFHVKDHQARNVGHYACISGDVACVHWLLSNDVDTFSVDVDGNGLAHFAAMSSDCCKVVNCLTNHKAPFDIVNKQGELPMGKARTKAHPVAFDNGLNGKVKCHLCLESSSEKNRRNAFPCNQNITNQRSLLFGTKAE